MRFRLVCDCGESARCEVDERVAPPWLDPMAIVLRAVVRRYAWRYVNGRIGKSVISCICPRCRGEAVFLEADFLPKEIVPGTYAEDQAIVIDSPAPPG